MEDNQKFEHTVIKTQMSMEQQTNCQLQINNMEKLIEAYEQKLNAENTINEDDKRFYMVILFIPKIF